MKVIHRKIRVVIERMIKYFVIMFKDKKYLFFFVSVILPLSFFISVSKVFATPVLNVFLLNENSQSVTFNPNNGENVSIGIIMSEPVKFTRVYICPVNAPKCNQSNSSRYFSPSTTSNSVSVKWDGKGVGDKEIVPDGEYKITTSFTQDGGTSISLDMTHSIFIDSSINNSSTTVSDLENDSSDLSINTNTTTTSNQSAQNVRVVTKTVYISTHSGEEDLSDYSEKTPFEISAGRERMALIGGPIEFAAKYNLIQKDECVPVFRWSFGDGFEAIGNSVEHTYKYGGEYQVVLNGNCGDYNSISRTVVKVISPDISISSLENGDIEMINNGKTEINIGEWKITGGQKDFIFPKDTIIGIGVKITLSKEDLNIAHVTGSVTLRNPSGGEVSSSKQLTNLETVSKNSTDISVSEAEKLLADYKGQLTLTSPHNITLNDQNEVDVAGNNDIGLPDIVQTASVIDSVSSSSSAGFMSKLIDIPIKRIKSFVRIFYDF